MTFNPNIPATGTYIDQTFNQIQTNFSQLDSIYAFDNYTWDDALVGNRGFHKKATLVGQGSAPSASTTAGILYAQTNSAGVTRIDPYYVYDSGALGAGLQSPILPFKAFGEFLFIRSGSATLFQSMNVASVIITNISLSNINFTCTVNLVNQLANGGASDPLFYPVFLGCSQPDLTNNVANVPIFSSNATTNKSFNILLNFPLSAPPSLTTLLKISFGVLQF